VEIVVNGQPQQAAEGTTVATLLADLGLAEKPLAVEVNRRLVPRGQHAGHRLAAGDQVEIVTMVGGG